MAFEKGQSGNPRGRPAKTQEQKDFERKCREYASKNGYARLEKWADSENAKESIPALAEIFNRGFGKPEQVQYSEVNVTAETGSSAKELADGLAALVGEPAPGGCVPPVQPSVDGGK